MPAAAGQATVRSSDFTGDAFEVTLRKAGNADSGLDLSESPGQRALRVERIRQGGAVDAWNRVVHGSRGNDTPG